MATGIVVMATAISDQVAVFVISNKYDNTLDDSNKKKLYTMFVNIMCNY